METVDSVHCGTLPSSSSCQMCIVPRPVVNFANDLSVISCASICIVVVVKCLIYSLFVDIRKTGCLLHLVYMGVDTT